MPYKGPVSAMEKIESIRAAHTPIKELDDFSRYDPSFHSPLAHTSPYFLRYEGTRKGGHYLRQAPAKADGWSIDPLMPLMSFINRFINNDGEDTQGFEFEAMSFAQTLKEIRKLSPPNRVLCEQIQQEHVIPGEADVYTYNCNPYMDYDLEMNTDGEWDRDIYTVDMLFEYYMIRLFERKRAEGVDGYDFDCGDIRKSTLDAYKPGKQSRHVIYHLPDNRFYYDNKHWGNIMVEICADTVNDFGIPTKDHPLFIYDKTTDIAKLIVDPSVYSFNRNMRLWGCVKKSINPNAPCYPLKCVCMNIYPECEWRGANDMAYDCPCQSIDNMRPAKFCSYFITFIPRDPSTGIPITPVVLVCPKMTATVESKARELFYIPKERKPRLTGFIAGFALEYGYDSEDDDNKSSSSGEPPAKKQRVDGGVRNVTMNQLAALACDAINRVDKEVRSDVFVVDVTGWVLMRCKSKTCIYAQREHKSNRIYMGCWMASEPVVFYFCNKLDCKFNYSIHGKKKMEIGKEQWAEYKIAYDKFIGNHTLPNPLLAYLTGAPIEDE